MDCCSTSTKTGHRSHHEMMVADFKRRFWISLPLALIVLALSPMIQEFFNFSLTFAGAREIVMLFSTFIFFYGGWPFLGGLYVEVKAKNPGMMTLIGVAITVAFVYSLAVFFGFDGRDLFWELVTLILIMLLGHWIEMRSVLGASKALQELSKLLPDRVRRVREDGKVEEIGLEELSVGEKVQVRPGEKVPVDGVVFKGEGSVNEALLSGESKPINKTQGSEVLGGSINLDGVLVVEVRKLGRDSYLSQVISLVERAQQQKSKTQDLANRAARWLTFVALGAGAITLLAWLFFSNQSSAYALQRTIAVIVIACPHALGLAIPLVVSFSTSIAASRGLLIRDSNAFENSRKLDTVVLDKTGTLTEGEFVLAAVKSFSQLEEQEVLALAGSLDAHSAHPLAKATAAKVEEKKEVEAFKALPGKGVEGKIGGVLYQLLSPGALEEKGIKVPRTKDGAEKGRSGSYLIKGGQVLGGLFLEDRVRSGAKEAVAKIKALGLEPIMLTGDSHEVAERVAKELGLEKFFAQVLPEKKAAVIEELQKQGKKVAMVGDGINDAPALAQADLGVAIGAGTDVAIETADVILAKNDPEDIALVIKLGQKTYAKMVQNLWWASGYNILAIPLAAGVLAFAGVVLSPAVGAVLMSLSTVIVAFNATLLKWQLR